MHGSNESQAYWANRQLDGMNEMQKVWLKERWLDQVIWMDGRASRHRNRYYRLRIFAIVGGILIPLLITMSQIDESVSWLAWVAAGLGALVAIAASVEEFYHDGERWRNYRNTVELLKSEGWHFINLSGPYRRFEERPKAFKKFATRVEDIIQQDVQTYLGDIVGDSESGEQRAGEAT
jgi:hypothetical protein